MRIRDRVGVSERRQRQLSWAMEMALVGMLFVGVERGSPGIVVNVLFGLAVIQLPPLLERDFDVPMDAGLTLWITAAVFLHIVGAGGLPGLESNLYRRIEWWDHVTHALSSSVVAAAGYSTVRAIDVHSDDVHLPSRFVFVFILMFVVAFGVVWEVLEFALMAVADATGASILTQYGLEDTMKDLLFDTLGGLVVAAWGAAYLTDVVGALSERLDARSRAE